MGRHETGRGALLVRRAGLFLFGAAVGLVVALLQPVRTGGRADG